MQNNFFKSFHYIYLYILLLLQSLHASKIIKSTIKYSSICTQFLCLGCMNIIKISLNWNQLNYTYIAFDLAIATFVKALILKLRGERCAISISRSHPVMLRIRPLISRKCTRVAIPLISRGWNLSANIRISRHK